MRAASGVPDTSHDAEIAAPQAWVRPVTCVDLWCSVPTEKARRTMSSPPTTATLAPVIRQAWTHVAAPTSSPATGPPPCMSVASTVGDHSCRVPSAAVVPVSPCPPWAARAEPGEPSADHRSRRHPAPPESSVQPRGHSSRLAASGDLDRLTELHLTRSLEALGRACGPAGVTGRGPGRGGQRSGGLASRSASRLIRLLARARRDRSVGCRCGRGGRCCRAGSSTRTPRARSSRSATAPVSSTGGACLHNGARLSVAVGPPCSGWSWLYGMTWSRSQCLALRPHHGNTQVPSRTITCSRILGVGR